MCDLLNEVLSGSDMISVKWMCSLSNEALSGLDMITYKQDV